MIASLYIVVCKVMSTEDNKNIGGRPKETPSRLIEAELRATVKTVRFTRELLEKQLETISAHLANNPDIPIDVRLTAVERLSTIAGALTKSLETLGKYSIGDANRRKPIDNDDNNNTGSVKSSAELRTLLSGKV